MWGHRFMMSQLSGKMWGSLLLAKRGEIGSKLCFCSIDEKIRKSLQVRTTRGVLNPSVIFFSVHETDHQ